MNLLKSIFAAFLLYLTPCLIFAQEQAQNTDGIKAQSISVRLLGSPTWPIGLSYGQMLTDRLSMEMGVGLISLGAGFDYYITKPQKNKLNFNTGIYGSFSYDGYPMFYVPLGASYLSKNDFQYNINVGVLYAENVSLSGNGNKVSPWFGLSIGRRFGEDFESIKKIEKTSSSNVISFKLSIVEPWIGINYERLLSPNLGLEATIGFLGASLGTNIYYPSLRPGKTSFKTGASIGRSLNPFSNGGYIAYVPVGVNYLNKSGFVFSLDGGPQYWSYDDEIFIGISIKVGKAF